jgi:DNA-binding response OmpR family regulator
MKTVLIVEDDPSNMDVFQYIFQNDGFTVLCARTANDARQAVQHTHDSIELVICDLQLPDGSGAHLALDLVQTHPGAAVLFLSGTPLGKWNDADMEDFRRLSSTRTGFLEKPFFPSMLKEKAGALLNEKRAIRGERVKPRHVRGQPDLALCRPKRAFTRHGQQV